VYVVHDGYSCAARARRSRGGFAKSGRLRSDIEIMRATLVVTTDIEEIFAASKFAARQQLAFYGSTPGVHEEPRQ